MSMVLNDDDKNSEKFILQIILKFLDYQLSDHLSKDDLKNLIFDEFSNGKIGELNIYSNKNINGIDNKIDIIVQSLVHMVKEFENKYKTELNVNLKSVTNEFNSGEVITSYEDIIFTLFEEKINTGRLVALFAFLSTTVVYLCEIDHIGTIKELILVTLKIFRTHLTKWIQENDGWLLIVEMSEKNKKLTGIDFEWCPVLNLKKTFAKIGMFAAMELAKSIFQ